MVSGSKRPPPRCKTTAGQPGMVLPPGRRELIDCGQGRRHGSGGRRGLVEVNRPLAVDRDQAADAVGHCFRELDDPRCARGQVGRGDQLPAGQRSIEAPQFGRAVGGRAPASARPLPAAGRGPAWRPGSAGRWPGLAGATSSFAKPRRPDRPRSGRRPGPAAPRRQWARGTLLQVVPLLLPGEGRGERWPRSRLAAGHATAADAPRPPVPLLASASGFDGTGSSSARCARASMILPPCCA